MSSSDLALLQRWCAERDAEAFAEVAKRHAGMVFGVCRRVLGDASDAEDIAQECFVALAQSALPPHTNLPGWLYRVAVNKARDHARSDSRRRRRETSYQQSRPEIVEVHWSDIEAFVDEAIAGLPDELREPLVAHFVEGQTQAEIAERLGVSRQTITHRIGQGVERVRKDLAKRGIGVTASALTLILTANMAEAAPATLVAALGKLAVSGIPVATGAPMLGGLVTAKIAGVAVAAVVLFGIVGMAAFQVKGRLAIPESGTQHTAVPPQALAENKDAAQPTEPKTDATNATAASGNELSDIRVVDKVTKEPVSGVNVVFVRPDKFEGSPQLSLRHRVNLSDSSIRRTSDTTGRVVPPTLTRGEYWAIVWRSAYFLTGGTPAYGESGGERIIRFTVDENGAHPQVQLEVLRGATVSGRVFDERRNEPVPAIYLDALAELPRGNVGRYVSDREGVGLTAQTDNQGLYRLEGLPPGQWEVVCWSRGGKVYPLAATISADCTPIDGLNFSVDLGVCVFGRVVDESGQPVLDANVRGVARGDMYLDIQVAETSADGSFTLWGYRQDSKLIVQAVKDGAISDFTGPYELASDLKDITVALKPGPSIDGVVVDLSGKPVANAFLYAHYLPENFTVGTMVNERGIAYGDFGFGVEATAGADGTFQFQGLVPGFYGLDARQAGDDSIGGNVSCLKRVEIQESSHLAGIRLVLGQPEAYGLSIKGRVSTKDGQPVPGALVTASRGAAHWEAKSDEAGRFTITGLSEGDCLIWVTESKFGGSEFANTTAGSEDVILYVQPTATIQGNVTDAVTGKPLDRFQLLCQDRQQRLVPGFLGGAGTAFTDGKYEIEGQSPGPKDLFVWVSGYVLARESLDLLPGENKRVDIQLQPTSPLKGIVVDEQGSPVASANVYLQNPEVSTTWTHFSTRSESQWRDAITDATGNFSIETLIPNISAVIAYKQGYALSSVEMPQGANTAQPITIVMNEGGTIEGHVTAAGQPPSDVATNILLHEVSSGRQERFTKCDAEGKYRIEHIPNGEYRIQLNVSPSGGPRERRRTFRRVARVESGAVVVVDFDVPAYEGSLQGSVTFGGQPANGALIAAIWTDAEGQKESAETNCDSEGRYTLENLPLGRIDVHINALREDGTVEENDFEAEVTTGQSEDTDFDF